jgi:cyclase
MLRHRIIPVLLNTAEGLVKTEKFKDPIYIGDPLNALRIFNQKFVDEILIIDIERSKLNLGPDLKSIERYVSECFMPLGYGGGIRNLTDAKNLLKLGVEKVIIQSAALNNPNLIAEIAEYSGSQSVAVAIDVERDKKGQLNVFRSSNNSHIDVPLHAFVNDLQKKGVGEIILTSVNCEGTMSGYDLDLIRQVSRLTNVPLVAHGGAGKLQHFADAIQSGADAVAAGSLFVFYGKKRGVLINYPDYSDLESLLGVKS